MMIRDDQTGSIWSHSEGVCVSGPLQGAVLERHPCSMTTWKRWRRLHPDTRLLDWPDHPLHRDGRHGHGARDYLGRPGIRAGRAFGLGAGDLDTRMPENEMVLGVNHVDGDRAYPLDAVHHAGGVVHDALGGDPVVIWSPWLDDHLTHGFLCETSAGVLDFEVEAGVIRDRGTGGVWSVEGTCVEGELEGTRLEPLDAVLQKWHGWSNFHPDTTIFATDRRMGLDDVPASVPRKVGRALADAGFRVEVERPVLEALLPPQSRAGLRLLIDGDRLTIRDFESELGAREYLLGADRARRLGRVVVEDDPEDRFRDAAQMEPVPDDEVDWSDLLESERFVDVVAAAAAVDATAVSTGIGAAAASDAAEVVPEGSDRPAEVAAVGFPELFEALSRAGYAVEDVRQLEERRVRPDAVTGLELTIAGDPFLAYRYRDPADARDFAAWHGHSLAAGAFVLRSDPPKQYKHMGLKASELSPDEIDWSPLLDDPVFIDEVRRAASA